MTHKYLLTLAQSSEMMWDPGPLGRILLLCQGAVSLPAGVPGQEQGSQGGEKVLEGPGEQLLYQLNWKNFNIFSTVSV